jgi:hypothetical protein
MIPKNGEFCKLGKVKIEAKRTDFGEKLNRFCGSIQVALKSNRTWIDLQSNLSCPKRVLYRGSQEGLF